MQHFSFVMVQLSCPRHIIALLLLSMVGFANTCILFCSESSNSGEFRQLTGVMYETTNKIIRQNEHLFGKIDGLQTKIGVVAKELTLNQDRNTDILKRQLNEAKRDLQKAIGETEEALTLQMRGVKNEMKERVIFKNLISKFQISEC